MKAILLSNSPDFALMDDEDYPLLSRHTWRLDGSGYVVSDIIRMHVLVIGRKPGCLIDHIDRNRLNNQKSNLRLVNHRANCWNSAGHRDSAAGLKGVHRRPSLLSKPWTARIGRKHLGYFATAKEAAMAYDVKARELHGEYAYQNFPDEGEPQ
jgi:hypothetical protein